MGLNTKARVQVQTEIVFVIERGRKARAYDMAGKSKAFCSHPVGQQSHTPWARAVTLASRAKSAA
jgi:hypothetical protein